MHGYDEAAKGSGLAHRTGCCEFPPARTSARAGAASLRCCATSNGPSGTSRKSVADTPAPWHEAWHGTEGMWHVRACGTELGVVRGTELSVACGT
ncbi:unnamed protein product [Lampetra planeri]